MKTLEHNKAYKYFHAVYFYIDFIYINSHEKFHPDSSFDSSYSLASGAPWPMCNTYKNGGTTEHRHEVIIVNNSYNNTFVGHQLVQWDFAQGGNVWHSLDWSETKIKRYTNLYLLREVS